jgi:Immunity protein 8
MKAIATGIGLVPEPATLPASPEDFSFVVRVLVAQTGTYGEESFDLTVCSPERLARRSDTEGIVPGLHHLVVRMGDFEPPRILDRVTRLESGWPTPLASEPDLRLTMGCRSITRPSRGTSRMATSKRCREDSRIAGSSFTAADLIGLRLIDVMVGGRDFSGQTRKRPPSPE